MEWRDVATAKLKEIGEAIAADVEGVLDDLQVPPIEPALIDLTDAPTEAPPPTS